MIRVFTAATLVAALAGVPGLGFATPRASAAEGWRWPVVGEVITPYRNGADPYAGGQHRGIDVAAPAGAPVMAATGGTVRFAARAGSSGLTVSIRTSDGRFDTSYLHLSTVSVQEGDRLAGGARVGAVGTSGRRSSVSPHLHFGVREAGSRHAYRDPLGFLPPLAPRRVPAPRGTPLPVGVPVRVHRAPAPVHVPSPMRVRVPARRPVRLPAGRRLRLPRPTGAPRVAHPQREPSPRAAPVAAPRGVPAAGPLPAGVPAAGPAPAHAVPRAAPAVERGPDVGWALACIALLLAAACMGSSGRRGHGGQTDRGSSLSRLRPGLSRR